MRKVDEEEDAPARAATSSVPTNESPEELGRSKGIANIATAPNIVSHIDNAAEGDGSVLLVAGNLDSELLSGARGDESNGTQDLISHVSISSRGSSIAGLEYHEIYGYYEETEEESNLANELASALKSLSQESVNEKLKSSFDGNFLQPKKSELVSSTQQADVNDREETELPDVIGRALTPINSNIEEEEDDVMTPRPVNNSVGTPPEDTMRTPVAPRVRPIKDDQPRIPEFPQGDLHDSIEALTHKRTLSRSRASSEASEISVATIATVVSAGTVSEVSDVSDTSAAHSIFDGNVLSSNERFELASETSETSASIPASNMSFESLSEALVSRDSPVLEQLPHLEHDEGFNSASSPSIGTIPVIVNAGSLSSTDHFENEQDFEHQNVSGSSMSSQTSFPSGEQNSAALSDLTSGPSMTSLSLQSPPVRSVSRRQESDAARRNISDSSALSENSHSARAKRPPIVDLSTLLNKEKSEAQLAQLIALRIREAEYSTGLSTWLQTTLAHAEQGMAIYTNGQPPSGDHDPHHMGRHVGEAMSSAISSAGLSKEALEKSTQKARNLFAKGRKLMHEL